jgi:hypothetical protein
VQHHIRHTSDRASDLLDLRRTQSLLRTSPGRAKDVEGRPVDLGESCYTPFRGLAWTGQITCYGTGQIMCYLQRRMAVLAVVHTLHYSSLCQRSGASIAVGSRCISVTICRHIFTSSRALMSA